MDFETDQARTRLTRRSVFSAPEYAPTAYQPEQWRGEQAYYGEATSSDQSDELRQNPNAREQSRLFDLLGRINHRILTGNRVYVEVEGVVYRTLYGGYWCSVFTGIQHFLLRCEAIQTSRWEDETANAIVVDLPINYANGGWTTQGCSLSFLLTRDQLQ